MTELPDDWKPDIPTLEFLGTIVAKEFLAETKRFDLVGKGSDRHESVGRLKVMGALTNLCKSIIDDVKEGKFPREEKEEKSGILISS